VVRFEILEHTADIGVRAFGRTLAELFENAALGLESIALEPAQLRPEVSFQLAASGEDREALLVNWLNEIVYYLDARHVAFVRFDVEAVTDGAITAQGWGEPRDPLRHTSRLVVKAATYHQLRVEQTPDGWIAEVYLDI
jgi:SHS2 domain-containing protein